MSKIKKRVSEKEIKRVVREWMERMQKAFKTELSESSDYNIDCPKCGNFRGISFYLDRGWMCRRVHCSLEFPKHLMPPSPKDAKTYFAWKEKIEMFLKSK